MGEEKERIRISPWPEDSLYSKVEASTVEDLLRVTNALCYLEQDNSDFPYWTLMQTALLKKI